MPELTRETVEEWLEQTPEGKIPRRLEGCWECGGEANSPVVHALCRALLAAWGYEAEARAGRPFLTVRDGRLYITDGISVSLLYSTNAAAYAAARAANEAEEKGGE